MTISFFAERQPIPRRVVHRVKSDGTLGDEIIEQRIVRDAMVRDAEVAVAMNLDIAKQVRDRLSEVLTRAEQIAQVGKQTK